MLRYYVLALRAVWWSGELILVRAVDHESVHRGNSSPVLVLRVGGVPGRGDAKIGCQFVEWCLDGGKNARMAWRVLYTRNFTKETVNRVS